MSIPALTITVSRIINDEGRMECEIRINPSTFSAVEAFGLLETGKWLLMQELEKHKR